MNEKSSGQIIQYYREQRSLTREELAQLLSVTPGKLSHWEDDITVPRPGMTARLVEILEIPQTDAQILLSAFETAKQKRLQVQADQQVSLDAEQAEEDRLAHKEKAVHLLIMGIIGFAAGFLFCFATGAYKDFPWYGLLAIGWAISGIPFGWKMISAEPKPYSPVEYYSLFDIFLKLLFFLFKFICAYLIGLFIYPVVLFYHVYKGCTKGSGWQKLMLVLLFFVVLLSVVLIGGLLFSSISVK